MTYFCEFYRKKKENFVFIFDASSMKKDGLREKKPESISTILDLSLRGRGTYQTLHFLASILSWHYVTKADRQYMSSCKSMKKEV